MQANKSKSCGDVHAEALLRFNVCGRAHIPQHEGSAGLMVGLRAVLVSAGRSLVEPNHIWLVCPAGAGGAEGVAVLVEEGVVSYQRLHPGLLKQHVVSSISGVGAACLLEGVYCCA
jgi:hypothetical protein